MRSMFNKEFFKCSQFTHINRCTFSLVINIAFCNIKRLRIFLTQKQRINCEKPYKYSIYQQNSKRKIRKFTTKLQQMKEPDVTTYKEKYRVLRNRHLKEVVFFCAV